MGSLNGSVRNYIVPMDSLTPDKQNALRESAYAKLVAHAEAKGVGSNPDVRVLWNTTQDLVAAPAVDDWQTAALAAVGTYYSCFQAVASPQLLVNRCAVFFGVNILTIPNPVSKLLFRKNGALGNIIASFDLEILESMNMMAGFFTEPVVFDPQDIFAAQVRAKIATGVASRVVLWTMVAEPRGSLAA